MPTAIQTAVIKIFIVLSTSWLTHLRLLFTTPAGMLPSMPEDHPCSKRGSPRPRPTGRPLARPRRLARWLARRYIRMPQMPIRTCSMISIERRRLLKWAGAIPLLLACSPLPSGPAQKSAAKEAAVFRRSRPSDPSWPSDGSWQGLDRVVGGQLIKVQSPLAACAASPAGASCTDVFRELKNPYYIGDQVGLTQTSGWVDAWSSAPSVYAVAARRSDDVIAAVNFARDNRLRLVVKGGGHSYQGTSNAADS